MKKIQGLLSSLVLVLLSFTFVAGAVHVLAAPSGPGVNVILTEGFENGALPSGWTQEYVYSTVNWDFPEPTGSPSGAHSGSRVARFSFDKKQGYTTRLVTPELSFDAGSYGQLRFWHYMEEWLGDQDELRVYYKTSAGGSWTLLAEYTSNVSVWTERVIELPAGSTTYYLAFEGKAFFGHGVVIDDVTVTTSWLGISKSVTPASITPAGVMSGTSLTYTLTFTNADSTYTATGVVISDSLPSGVTAGSILSSGVAITQVGTPPDYVWAVQDLAPGEGGVITITGVLSPPLVDSRVDNTATMAASLNGMPATRSDTALLEISGPALYLPLNEAAGATTFADASGVGNAGACSGAACPTAGVDGPARTALRFDGADDYVEVPYEPFANLDSFTVAAWVQANGGSGSYRAALTSRDVSPSRGYTFYATNTDEWQFWAGDGGTGWHMVGSAPVSTGVWTHLAGVYDAQARQMQFYVNGALNGELSNVYVHANRQRPLRMGAGTTEGAPDFFFPGAIDEVRVYAGALTSDEIADLAVALFAYDDSYSVYENRTLTIPAAGVLANDVVTGGGTLTAALSLPPAHGALALAPDGGFVYTPTLDFVGSDAFTYVAHAGALTDTATVSITVNPNLPPVAVDDAYSATQSLPLTVAAPGVLGNDSDPEGDPLTATLLASPSHGTIALQLDGSFTYTPTIGYLGEDAFTYVAYAETLTDTATVSITVTPNQPPVAVDDAYSTPRDVPLTVSAPGVLANDSDPDEYPLTAALLAPPSRGTVALRSDGSFTYTPEEGFSGEDAFSYVASDGVLTDTATVSLTVRDTLRLHLPFDEPSGATTFDDASGNGHDAACSGDSCPTAGLEGPRATALDFDGADDYVEVPYSAQLNPDSFTVAAWVKASGGSGAYRSVFTSRDTNATNGYMIYATGDNYWQLWIGTSGGWSSVGSAPVVLDRWTHLAATYEGGTLRFYVNGQPAGSQSGAYLSSNTQRPLRVGAGATEGDPTFFFPGAIDDVRLYAEALAPAQIDALSAGVYAFDDGYSIRENLALAVPAAGVLANDLATGGTLTASLALPPAHGALALAADGSFVYTPTSNFAGSDAFTYVAHAGGMTDTAVVSLTVEPNLAPLAGDDAYTAYLDIPLVEPAPGLLANDSDSNGDSLTAALLVPPSHGALDLRPDGSFAYTPTTGYLGADAFHYVAGDGMLTGTAVVTITIFPRPCHMETTGDDVSDYSSVDASALQLAVDAAAPGDLIRVAGYCEGVLERGGLVQTLYVSKSLTLRGGYTAEDWSLPPDPATRVTTLDAQDGGRVLYVTSGTSLTLEGLVLSGGYNPYSEGGGIYSAGDLTLRDAELSDNEGYYGGGIYVASGSSVLEDVVLERNKSGSSGGGVYVVAGGVLSVTRSAFYANTTGTYNLGGGIYSAGTLTLTRSTLQGNRARYGAGVYAHGSATVEGVAFVRNSAGYGGGMASAGSLSTLINVTLYDNEASYAGGGIYNSGNLILTNAVLWGNRDSSGSNQIYEQASAGGITVTYSLVQGNPITGTGNLDADPQFVDAAGGNLRLRPGSPAIDAGAGGALPPGTTADLDGLARVVGPAVDMGAYESQYERVCGIAAGSYAVGPVQPVNLDFADPGDLACVTVTYFPTSHPSATVPLQNGLFWSIGGENASGVPVTSGFTATLTLPYAQAGASSRACRYPGGMGGAGWDCGDGSHTTHLHNASVSRQVSHFSDWAVGSDLTPTVVRANAFAARGGAVRLSGFALLALAALAIVRLRRRR